MRKYDIKNKRYIAIIGGVLVIIIVIFSLFLKKVIDAGKIEYVVDANSVVFDADKNMYTISDEAKLKIKWSGNYYMIDDDEMINLTDHSVIYNLNSGDINLYGTYYEVLNTGDVEILENENIIKSSVKSHFYKLDDRKYLIIDRTIESEDGMLVTANYLLVSLDRSGNATLLNNDINLKTFNPKVLKTSSFTFDISNEIINFGGEDIDLKEIIGSTNEFGKHKGSGGSGSSDGNTSGVNGGTGSGGGGAGGSGSGGSGTGDGTGSGGGGAGGSGSGGSGTGNGTGSGGGGAGGSGSGGSGTGNGTGSGGGGAGGSGSGGSGTGNGTGSGNGSGSGSGSGGGGGGGGGAGGSGVGDGSVGDGLVSGNTNTNTGYEGGYNSGVSNGAVAEIINAAKNTSVIRVTTGLSSIGVDYVIYDPENEYQSVYVELEEANNIEHTTAIYLSKNDTNLTISDLKFNTVYNLYFKYTYFDASGALVAYTFDEVTVSTKTPGIALSVTGIFGDKLYYKISFDNYYTVTGGVLNLFKNNQGVTSINIDTAIGSTDQIVGTIDNISQYKFSKGDTITLSLASLNINLEEGFEPAISYRFIY